MSEDSDSYHVRAEDHSDVMRLLRKARAAGFYFGPANGWLTFVPYEESRLFRENTSGENFTLLLSGIVESAVLHYTYQEDYGWGFSLARPREPLGSFACSWHPEPFVTRDHLDDEALATLAPARALAPLLVGFDTAGAARENPGYRFAETLGLPAYKWLSPRLARHDTADLIARGGRRLGTKPPTAPQRLKVPPGLALSLPRPDLSAKEALTLARPFTATFGPAWFLVSLVGQARLNQDGRLDPRVGSWRFTYARVGGAGWDFVHVNLSCKGNLAFHGGSERAPVAVTPEAMRLPPDWLDSIDVAAAIANEPRLDGIADDFCLSMSFKPRTGGPPCWDVTRLSGIRARHSFAVDASSGEILAEYFVRREDAKVVESRWRVRAAGGDWRQS